MPPKYLRTHSSVCFGVDVADDDEHRVVRRVVGLEELLDVAERRGVEVLEVAVEVVRVVPVGVGELRQVEPRETAVRLVEHVDLDFVLHDSLLIREVLRVICRPFMRSASAHSTVSSVCEGTTWK